MRLFGKRSGGTQPPVRRPVEGDSFPPQATGTTRTLTMRAPTATIGLRPSIRATSAARTTSTSIPAKSAGTSAAAPTGDLSVLSQNSRASREESQACLQASEAPPCLSSRPSPLFFRPSAASGGICYPFRGGVFQTGRPEIIFRCGCSEKPISAPPVRRSPSV